MKYILSKLASWVVVVMFTAGLLLAGAECEPGYLWVNFLGTSVFVFTGLGIILFRRLINEVSILVLMEFALHQYRATFPAVASISFNPCFNGICSSSFPFLRLFLIFIVFQSLF